MARRRSALRMCENSKKPTDGMMQRPVLDNIVTKGIYSLEMLRIRMVKEKPTEENGGWKGSPERGRKKIRWLKRCRKFRRLGCLSH